MLKENYQPEMNADRMECFKRPTLIHRTAATRLFPNGMAVMLAVVEMPSSKFMNLECHLQRPFVAESQ